MQNSSLYNINGFYSLTFFNSLDLFISLNGCNFASELIATQLIKELYGKK